MQEIIAAALLIETAQATVALLLVKATVNLIPALPITILLLVRLIVLVTT